MIAGKEQPLGNELSTASRRPGAGTLRLHVGDTVVYASHGVGRVVACEQRLVADSRRDCVVVDLASGLRVTLTLEEATQRLRAVADDREFESVRETLAADADEREISWTRRIRENKAKLIAGRVTDLAELVRDGGRLERRQNGSRLSPGERTLYVQARRLLVGEICSARGVDADEADAWIEAQFAQPETAG